MTNNSNTSNNTQNTSPEGIVQGTDGNDVIDLNYTGDPDGDRIDNDDGVNGTVGDEDFVLARDGDDTVEAGAGDDLVLGEDGGDTLRGQDGDDILYGGDGDERIVLGALLKSLETLRERAKASVLARTLGRAMKGPVARAIAAFAHGEPLSVERAVAADPG